MGSLTEAQIRALSELDDASKRLEKARKELTDATRDHNLALRRAKQLCPYVVGGTNRHPDEDDE